MRNRAKCKLCGDIIESMHATDLVLCKCEHIFVDKGDGLKCGSGDWANFLRIDDDGKEVEVKVSTIQLDSISQDNNEEAKLSKAELLGHLEEMVKSYNNLPQQAMMSPITHYDHQALLLLLSAILRCD